MKSESFELAKERRLKITADQRRVISLFFDGHNRKRLDAEAVAEALGRTRQAVRFSLKRLEAAEVLLRSREEGGRRDIFHPSSKAEEILGLSRKWDVGSLR